MGSSDVQDRSFFATIFMYLVVRVDTLGTNPTILWSAATSLAAPTTTNNRTEYAGLVTGLTAVHRYVWGPLHVIDDSSLIIGQVSAYRRPKNDELRKLYALARRLADQVGVVGWHHHLRAFNKMAPAAANVAMDTRTSIHTLHPTHRPEWAGLPALLDGDVSHWLAPQMGPTNSG